MKRKIFSLFLALCMVMSLFPAMSITAKADSTVWDGTTTASFAGGSGSSGAPYQIATAEQLAKLANDVNGGNTYSGYYFELTDNIVLNTWTDSNNDGIVADTELSNVNNSGSPLPWTPIGYFISDSDYCSFEGTFDGGGFTVSGIYISSSSRFQGLFGYILSGTIENVGVVNNYIFGGGNVGGVVGYSNSSSAVSNCYNTGTVSSSGATVGGVVGYSNSSSAVSNCYNTGTVSSSGATVGGVVGENFIGSTVSHCYNTGTVSSSSNNVGGVIGENQYGTVSHCYNTGTVSSSSNNVGGVVGENQYGTVSNCYNTGNVSGTGTYTGGVLGSFYNATISYCYNAGTVTGSFRAGGVSGSGNGASYSIEYCYNIGPVTGSYYVGGVVGSIVISAVSNCYYDKQVCPVDYGVGNNNATSNLGLTTLEMTGTAMYADTSVWTLASDMYPRLADYDGFDMDEVDEAVLYALPVYLDSNDTAESVTKNFTVGTLTGASWSMTANSAISFDGTNASVTKQAADTNATLTVTYQGLSRSIDLTVPTCEIWDGSAVATEFSGGTGKSGDPYQISSSEELVYLRYLVNNGELDNVNNGGATYAGLYYELTNDIYLNEAASNFENWGTNAPSNTWTPIGDSANKFTGSFNGNDHTVSGIFIKTTNNYQGLFGYASGASIEHVGVIDSYISGNNVVGGVVGNTDSSGLTYCYNAGSIFATIAEKDAYVGGLAGIGSASNCYNTGSITGGDCAGGILGRNTAPVRDCYNTGSVSGTNQAGGIVGCCWHEVSNCYNTGNITGTNGSIYNNVAVGGIAGFTYGGIYNCYNTGTISGSDSTKVNAGGIIGECSDIVKNCFNFGNITGSGTTVKVGGLTGISNHILSNCYNVGNVSGTQTGTNSGAAYVGSISGFISNETQFCYWLLSATQTVNGSERTDADKLAIAAESRGTAENCYTFSGSGTAWTLSNSSYTLTTANGNTVSVSENSSLIDALNSWVDEVHYDMWTLTGSATGYPILGALYNPISGTVTIAVTNGSGDSSDQICIDAILTATPNTTPSTNLSYQWQVSANGSSGWINATGSGNSTSAYTVGSSDGGKYLRVKVVSSDAASAVYSDAMQVPGNSSGGGSSSGLTTTPTGTAVYVNGETYTAGETENGTNENGQTQTTVTVDTDKLQKILESQGAGATITVPITTGSAVSSGVLTGQMVKNMETKDATLVVQMDSATYTLPAKEIDIDEVAGQFGEEIDLSDIEVKVTISEPDDSTVQVTENAAEDGGFTLIVQPVEFTVECQYKGKSVEIDSFNAYVERTIKIPDGVSPNKITTAVVVNADGTVRHVPTEIVEIGGVYYAVINSLTNSVYTLINNDLEFGDVEGHWAQDAINDMGSRMVINGDENGSFNPDDNITRAEFAAIIVRAIGLAPGTGESGFVDISVEDWYCGSIETASAYGIIAGYGDGIFGPNDTITREQAMAMIARAMKITGLEVSLSDSDIGALLEDYLDGAFVSDYAVGGIAACLQTGIVSGRSDAMISPKDYVTRAEVAVMVQRLLQKSELI